jgi:hypothetical protein
MRKALFNASVFTIGILTLSLGAIAQNNLLGKWKDEKDDKRVVEIYLAKDGLYYGKVVRLPDTNAKLGHLIFQKCSFDAKTESLKGTMHPPKGNVAIDATIQLDKSGKLKVVGKKFLLTKTLYFIKEN